MAEISPRGSPERQGVEQSIRSYLKNPVPAEYLAGDGVGHLARMAKAANVPLRDVTVHDFQAHATQSLVEFQKAAGADTAVIYGPDGRWQGPYDFTAFQLKSAAPLEGRPPAMKVEGQLGQGHHVTLRVEHDGTVRYSGKISGFDDESLFGHDLDMARDLRRVEVEGLKAALASQLSGAWADAARVVLANLGQ